MREYLFRGKAINNGNWIIGGFTLDAIGNPRITTLDYSKTGLVFHEVIPETIGQFTGLTDKKRVKIFEGDIFKLGVEKEVFEARFEHGCFMAFCNGKQYGLIGELQMCFINIIGNIHDNPELLK